MLREERASVNCHFSRLAPRRLQPQPPAAWRAGWILDLQAGEQVGRSPAERCPCRRRLCKVTTDCFPFQRQTLWMELFPGGLWGDGGWVGTSEPSRGWSHGPSLGWRHRAASSACLAHLAAPGQAEVREAGPEQVTVRWELGTVPGRCCGLPGPGPSGEPGVTCRGGKASQSRGPRPGTRTPLPARLPRAEKAGG